MEITISGVCEPDASLAVLNNHKPHDVEHVLHTTSLILLVVLLAQLLLMIVAVGAAFFCHFFMMLDLVIVSASIVIDLTVSGSGAELIIVLTLWRVLRIIHGMFATVETSEHQRHQLVHRIQHLEQELDRERHDWRVQHERQEKFARSSDTLKTWLAENKTTLRAVIALSVKKREAAAVLHIGPGGSGGGGGGASSGTSGSDGAHAAVAVAKAGGEAI